IRGRMSPYSAVAFGAIGIALLCLPRPGLRPVVWPAATLMTGIGALSFIGYLWNASELITDRWLPPVAVNTALAFSLLGVGTLLTARPGVTRRRSVSLASVERRVLASFVGALMLLLFGGGLTYRAGSEYVEASQSVAHSHEVRVALGHLYGVVTEVEAAQR